MIRRFQGKDLGESASRRVGFHFQTDYAKSNRSQCRVCKSNIDKDVLRVALMLQDEEGYKSAAWTHGLTCFWKYRETKKLRGLHEVVGLNKLLSADQAWTVPANGCDVSSGSFARTLHASLP